MPVSEQHDSLYSGNCTYDNFVSNQHLIQVVLIVLNLEPILLTSLPPCPNQLAPNESCRSWTLFPAKCLLLCRNNFAKIWSCFASFRGVYKTKAVVKQERLGGFNWRFVFFAFQFGCSEWRSIDHRNNWRNTETSHPNCSSGRKSTVLDYMKLFTALLIDCVHRFHIDHNRPCLVPQILHNLCLRFILGRLLYL